MRFQSFVKAIHNTGHLSDSTNLVVNPGPEGAALERTHARCMRKPPSRGLVLTVFAFVSYVYFCELPVDLWGLFPF
jgi:hypothetical protein